MDRYQTLMADCPKKKAQYACISFCSFSFAVFPVVLSFFGIGYKVSIEAQIWMAIGYHILNFLAAVCIFFGYMKESFLNVWLSPGKFLKAVGIGSLLMVAVAVLAFFAGIFLESTVIAYCGLPVTEMDLFAFSYVLVLEKPIVGFICMVLLTPFAASLLYYASRFAPICNSRPRFAYIMTAIFLAIPHIINALTFWLWSEQLIMYLVRLPIHLIACRIYHKTDTVWAPIAAHMVVNLIACVFLLLVGM